MRFKKAEKIRRISSVLFMGWNIIGSLFHFAHERLKAVLKVAPDLPVNNVLTWEIPAPQP